MDLQYYGGNCLVLSSKGVRAVIDDNMAELGQKDVVRADDIALYTSVHGVPKAATKLIIDGPGEYEVSGLSIVGIAARAHMDEEGTHNATMYKVMFDDTSYLFVGHIYPELNDDQLESIGMVDVMVAPVGGNGYTLDSTGALHLIKKVEPKVFIPTHYSEAGLRYPVEQQSLEQALKNLSTEQKEPVAKFRFKPGDISNTTQMVLLSRG